MNNEFITVDVSLENKLEALLLMSGLMAFAATHMPAASPPPLTGTTMASNSGTCSKNSTATVP